MKVMHSPRSLDLDITNKCNLKCNYCSHFESPGDTGLDLDQKTWLKFFKELGKCCVLDVSLQGGEPFCRKDLNDLIDGIVKNNMRYSILSNGTLITKKIAKFIAATNRCNTIQVSIDGSSKNTHDYFRGKGNFAKAIKGIENLQNELVPVAIRVTIHQKNVYDLENIAKYLLLDLKLPSFSINSVSNFGLCKKNTKKIQITVEQRSYAIKTLLKLNKEYNGRITATSGPLAEGLIWQKMFAAAKNNEKPFNNCSALTACNGIFAKLAVRSDGIYIPCIQLPHMEIGKINKDSLIDVWQNSKILNEFRNRNQILLNTFEKCKNCDFINYCTGDCPAGAFEAHNKVNHPDTSSCLKTFLDNGGTLPENIDDCA